jgi:hypothetical protein
MKPSGILGLQCEGIKENGEQCKCWARVLLNEIPYCLQHAYKELRALAAIKGTSAVGPRSQTQGAHHGQHSIDCDECRVFRKAAAKGEDFPK